MSFFFSPTIPFTTSLLSQPLLLLFTTLPLLLLSYTLYNLLLHPLRSYPGPPLYAASLLPHTLAFNRGRLPHLLLSLHKKYGPVVRVGPNVLSYAHPDAWRDIKGHRKAGEGENGKDADFFWMSRQNILGAKREDHARHRRALAGGFSAKALAGQWGLIRGYVDLFSRRLKEEVVSYQRGGNEGDGPGAVLDMTAWFNHATFDIIGDLAFGRSFDCLDKGEAHPWVESLLESTLGFAKLVTVRRYAPWLMGFVRMVAGVGKGQERATEFAVQRVEQRLQDADRERPDFVDALTVARKEEDGLILSRDEMIADLRLLILAGSETTATALAGAAYYLCLKPEVQRKLVDEVRGTFASEDEINMQSATSRLKYMLAFLNETLRIYPPVSSGMTRVCQEGGDVICGRHVPGGTLLEVSAWVMTHDTRNFTSPDDFIPERWMPESTPFPNDRLDASQPFSTGPRNCIGMNLAYMEMRVILARLLWNFDLEFADQEEGPKWIDQNIFNLWVKPELKVKLIPVNPR